RNKQPTPPGPPRRGRPSDYLYPAIQWAEGRSRGGRERYLRQWTRGARPKEHVMLHKMMMVAAAVAALSIGVVPTDGFARGGGGGGGGGGHGGGGGGFGGGGGHAGSFGGGGHIGGFGGGGHIGGFGGGHIGAGV